MQAGRRGSGDDGLQGRRHDGRGGAGECPARQRRMPVPAFQPTVPKATGGDAMLGAVMHASRGASIPDAVMTVEAEPKSERRRQGPWDGICWPDVAGGCPCRRPLPGSMTVLAGDRRFRLRRRQPGRAGRRGQYRDSTRTAGTVPRIMNNDRQLHLRMTQGTVGTVESDVLAFRLRASRQTRERRFPRFDCPYCPQPAQAPCAS